MSKQIPVLLILLLGVCPVQAADIAVIVGRDTPEITLTPAQLENIFRKKTRLTPWSQAWVPVNLHANHRLRRAFSLQLFEQPPEQQEEFWNIQYFNGITPPYVVTSEEAVLRFVTDTPNAIGYVLDCHLDARVKVLLRLTAPEHSLPCVPGHAEVKP
ncbi:MAG: hypothetical protein RQ715_08520 [Methylococcales bacterium]|nr:hypothetical protein [Methylococcales bacterium]